MTYFSPDPLTGPAIQHLDDQQLSVNNQLNRKDQYEKALNLWNGRKNKQTDQIWAEIEEKLSSGHPVPGICQYCEFDRITAVEHFFPKKHFPEKAFDWENYLWACTKCNSTYKGTKFAVFNPAGSDTVYPIPDIKSQYPQPPSDDPVLIHPRKEKPQDYLEIDLPTGIFLAKKNINNREIKKAEYTIDLLHLNKDATLLRFRKEAVRQYFSKVKLYINVKQSIDYQDLFARLDPPDRAIVVQTNLFAVEKQRLLQVIKEGLLGNLFPCVWQEIKRQPYHPFFEDQFKLDTTPLQW